MITINDIRQAMTDPTEALHKQLAMVLELYEQRDEYHAGDLEEAIECLKLAGFEIGSAWEVCNCGDCDETQIITKTGRIEAENPIQATLIALTPDMYELLKELSTINLYDHQGAAFNYRINAILKRVKK